MNAAIAITAGEPAGIGADLIVQLAQHPLKHSLVVIGDRDLLQQRARLLGVPIALVDYADHHNCPSALPILHVPLDTTCTAGKLDGANMQYVLKTLEIAGHGCLTKQFSAVVTTPVNKQIINAQGLQFTGQTEFFARLCDQQHAVMLLTTPGLRVALVTTHLPLAQVPAAITC